jgi:hypothetical protein
VKRMDCIMFFSIEFDSKHKDNISRDLSQNALPYVKLEFSHF